MRPLLAIVGRPNVGKSTLFNRIAGRRLAIVEDVPGVTRDRQYADADWNGKPFTVIDTGGFVLGEEDDLLRSVREQAQLAVEECDVVLFVVDGREALTAADIEVGEYLRRSNKRVLVVANKLDHPRAQDQLIGEAFRLGLGEVYAVSAAHGSGVETLLDVATETFPVVAGEEDEPEERPRDDRVRVAIVGRPNVGKSTLINALLKKQRVVASPEPGTTRDPIDSEIEVGGRKFILTDTAGIRRKKTIAQRVEQFAVFASLKVIERSDVAVLVIDASEPAVDQDAKIAGVAEEKGRALIVCVNKWDRVPKDKRKQDEFRDELKYQLKFVAYAPMIFASALTGSKVEKVIELAGTLADQFRYRAATPHLNRLLQQLVDSHPAPIVGGKPLRLYYIAQVGTSPPTFALTCNRPDAVPNDYRRYLINQLRIAFGFKVPIRLLFRARPGQAKRAARKNPAKKRHRT